MRSPDKTLSLYIAGLRDAHAMEHQALSIMRPQASRIESYPEVAEKLVAHIAETDTQIERLAAILTGLDKNHSGLKDMALSAAGSMAALGHTVAADEILKNSFANFAFENFEIAAYKSLIALAQELDRDGDVTPLKASLGEEMAMAAWLDGNIEALTLQYAALREAGETAKK